MKPIYQLGFDASSDLAEAESLIGDRFSFRQLCELSAADLQKTIELLEFFLQIAKRLKESEE